MSQTQNLKKMGWKLTLASVSLQMMKWNHRNLITVNDQNVYKDALQSLKSDHECRPINVGQQMLLEKFPNTASLHDTCFCDTLAFL